MTIANRFENMIAGEKHVLTFQFNDELDTGETITGTPTIAVTVRTGIDATPAALVVSIGFDGTSKNVLVLIAPTIRRVDYELLVVAATSNSNKILARKGLIFIE